MAFYKKSTSINTFYFIQGAYDYTNYLFDKMGISDYTTINDVFIKLEDSMDIDLKDIVKITKEIETEDLGKMIDDAEKEYAKYQNVMYINKLMSQYSEIKKTIDYMYAKLSPILDALFFNEIVFEKIKKIYDKKENKEYVIEEINKIILEIIQKNKLGEMEKIKLELAILYEDLEKCRKRHAEISVYENFQEIPILSRIDSLEENLCTLESSFLQSKQKHD